MPPDRRAHGATIHAIRTARGLRLADLACDGLSKGHLSHIENGRYRATPEVTARIAKLLDVPPEALTGQVPPLRPLRRILGVPAADVAAAANMTPARLDRIERGTERPHPDELALIARRLGVDPAALDAGVQRAEPVA